MLILRKAQMEDCQVIYDLRNDPQVRANSFDNSVIPYDSHEKWFSVSMENKSRRIFIIQEGKTVLGAVRFDMNLDFSEAVVSINVASSAWGKGIGTFALQEGERVLKEEFGSIKGITARILDENTASKKLFSKCKYVPRMVEFYKEVE